MTQETIRWFAGVDWGSERHQVCIVDGEGSIAGERAFPHSGAGLAELCDWLLSIAGEASVVAAAIDVPHGPVVDSLIDRDFVVHAINPRQLDRLRSSRFVRRGDHALAVRAKQCAQDAARVVGQLDSGWGRAR